MNKIIRAACIILGVLIVLNGLGNIALGQSQNAARDEWNEWDKENMNDYSDSDDWCRYYENDSWSYERRQQEIAEQCGPEYTDENATSAGPDDDNPYENGNDSIITGLFWILIGFGLTYVGIK